MFLKIIVHILSPMVRNSDKITYFFARQNHIYIRSLTFAPNQPDVCMRSEFSGHKHLASSPSMTDHRGAISSLRQLGWPFVVRSSSSKLYLVNSCMSSSQFFSGTPIFSRPRLPLFEIMLCRVIWPNQESFRRFTVDNKDSCFPVRNPLAVSRIRSFCVRCRKWRGVSCSTHN